jgi:hypothetical protein
MENDDSQFKAEHRPMAKVDLKFNSDGTITAIYQTAKKKDVYSFTNYPWYSDADRFDQAKWGFVSLGVTVDPEAFNIKRRTKR